MEWTQRYLELVRELDIRIADDNTASVLLDRLIGKRQFTRLESIIKNRPVLILGPGPSLEMDMQKIKDYGLSKKFIYAAVDGAVYIMRQHKIVPHINVTDLDGDLDSIIWANKHGTVTVIHAHHDNIKQIHEVVPDIKGSVMGVTRGKPYGNIGNFGGFTDADIAAHIIERHKPKMIILAGLDYGHVIGVHSGTYDVIKKPRKMKISKRFMEELFKASKTRVINVTSGGEHIQNTEKMDIEHLKHMMGV